jgi:hypothetical protein
MHAHRRGWEALLYGVTRLRPTPAWQVRGAEGRVTANRTQSKPVKPKKVGERCWLRDAGKAVMGRINGLWDEWIREGLPGVGAFRLEPVALIGFGGDRWKRPGKMPGPHYVGGARRDATTGFIRPNPT